MKWNELDNELKNILEEPIQPSSKVWDRIEHRLNNNGIDNNIKKTIYPYKRIGGIAASIVGIVSLAIGGYYLINNNNNEIIIPNNTPIVQNDIQTIESAQQNTSNAIINQLTLNTQSSKRLLAHISNDNITAKKEDAIAQVSKTYIEKLSIDKLTSLGSLIQDNISIKLPIANKEFISNSNTNYVVSGMNFRPEDILIDAPKVNHSEINKYQPKESSLAVSGGYHYNNMLQGAALALSASRDISKKFYIDANVGFVINNPSPYTEEFSGDFLALRKNGVQSMDMMAVSSPIFQPAGNLSYLQINPSIGYKVTNKLKMAMGVDLQQLLNNENDIVLFREHSSQLLPKQDFGLTSSVEYKINNRLSTALTAREGVNSLIQNNTNIANRRYVQLLLKLRINKNKR